MNKTQIPIFFNCSKVIRQFVRLFICFVKFANASANLKLFCFDFCNKNNFSFSLPLANLTKRVHQHCGTLDFLKKISICFTYVATTINSKIIPKTSF